MTFGGFEWDAAKAESNARKHGVTFEQAVEALTDPHSVEMPDATGATRVVTFGLSVAGVLFVVSTERGDRTRIISARKASRAQRRHYEEG